MGRGKWKFKRTIQHKYGRKVWKVADHKGTRGYFKYPCSENQKKYRILVANEFLAAALARLVGLPAAKLKSISIRKRTRIKKGVVSLKANAKQAITWKKAKKKVRRHPNRYIKKADRLAQLIPFDAWILNVDRTSHNLILYRNRKGRRFNWYLIDHEIALFGYPDKWKLKKGRKRVKKMKRLDYSLHSKKQSRLRIPAGLKSFTKANRELADNMIAKIESLTRSDIKKAIKQVPKGHLKKAEKLFIRNLLLSRKKKLRNIVGQILGDEK